MKRTLLFVMAIASVSLVFSCKKKSYLCDCQDTSQPTKGHTVFIINATSSKKANKSCYANDIPAASQQCSLTEQ